MKKKLALLLVLMMSLLTASALAVVQPGEDFYYLDTAEVLSTEAEGTVYFCNQLLEEACGAQIVVAALDSIDGADIYDYAYDLFNEWGIGSAEENNGFLLLMAIEEDNYYALSGAGVDGIFSSAELNQLFDKYLEPDFAKKDYEAGALKFFEAVLDKYIDRYNLKFSYADGEKEAAAYLSNAGGGLGAAPAEDSYGGGQPGGGAYAGDFYYEEEDDDFMGWVIAFVVIVAVLAISGANRRRRGGSFWGGFLIGSSRHHHHHHAPRHHQAPPPRVRVSREPRSSAPRSGFGGGFSGGGRSSSGRSSFSGSFGGGRSGGGRSFGGGAGRGRR